jgi:hypothetical protein
MHGLKVMSDTMALNAWTKGDVSYTMALNAWTKGDVRCHGLECMD